MATMACREVDSDACSDQPAMLELKEFVMASLKTARQMSTFEKLDKSKKVRSKSPHGAHSSMHTNASIALRPSNDEGTKLASTP